MSQMSGPIAWNLDTGVSWNAVIAIVPTGQSRRKVVAEFGSRASLSPRLLVQLDVFDRLSFVLVDRNGLQTQTEGIPSDEFALRPTWISAEAYCDPFDADTTLRTVRAQVRLNGVVRATTTITGDFGGRIEDGAHSFGATLAETDPATFTLSELFMVGRAPLSDEEVANILAYLSEKHEIGRS